jgi:hypothetical protein
MKNLCATYEGPDGRETMIMLNDIVEIDNLLLGWSELARKLKELHEMVFFPRPDFNTFSSALFASGISNNRITFLPTRKFVWTAPPSYWSDVLDTVRAIDLPKGGHQYFEPINSETGKVEIIKIGLMEL